MGREIQDKIIQRQVTKYIRLKDNETLTKLLKTLIRFKKKVAGKIPTQYLDSEKYRKNMMRTPCDRQQNIITRVKKRLNGKF
jgi:hypothetical protein